MKVCDGSLGGCTPAASSRCGRTTRPTTDFTAVLGEVFASAEAHLVTFANPLTGGTSSNTVYVATTARQSGG